MINFTQTVILGQNIDTISNFEYQHLFSLKPKLFLLFFILSKPVLRVPSGDLFLNSGFKVPFHSSFFIVLQLTAKTLFFVGKEVKSMHFNFSTI